MTKGVPSGRSQRYKANIKLQEQRLSTPLISGNDVLPSPSIIHDNLVTQPEGAQRAFETVRVLQQTLLHMSLGNHIYDLLKLLGLYISDCLVWYNEVYDCNNALQQQLDEPNSKMLVQDSEILNLQDQLKKCQATQEFYRQQALKADPPRRGCPFVSSEADIALSPAQLYQLLMAFRFTITPWTCCTSSTLILRIPSSKSLHHPRSFSRCMSP